MRKSAAIERRKTRLLVRGMKMTGYVTIDSFGGGGGKPSTSPQKEKGQSK